MNRWRIPIGAVLVHICIGSVYAWSTFNRPIQAIFPDAPWWFSPPYTTFTTALALLGLSAAFGGPWVERRGPRVAATAAAIFFGTGLVIGGIGLALRQSVLVFLGMGVIGGIGCGLGYISPVSMLVKWFPDRRGMATGMAIMGFGGGAFVAGYLNVLFMDLMGVAMTVIALGATYLVVMLAGSRLMRLPPLNWTPPGWTPPTKLNPMIASTSVTRDEAIRTLQFYLLWGILFINVTAGIGILAQASPMMQDMFKRTPIQAAAVVSIISLFNAGGRFIWASGSDYIGRRNTYTVFFVAQFILFLMIPGLAANGQWWLFQISLFIVFTMYGGGFATIPAFLADIFGPQNVGAIHGALLTAWTAAAIVGPVIITELSNRAKAALPPGADRVNIYDTPLQVLAALLAVGFVLTLLVRPLRASARPATHATVVPSRM
ncbi:MAG TPA: OFA family MFS transporter [Vicinamibacterales bacterium]|jgi:MFS transporter, OFA family, oxalate/formate antiporter|nr:OFA family MFS transporter [Vicinamibacterales bacterium]